LEGHRTQWLFALQRLLRETEANLAQVRNLTGPERDQVVADFESERYLLAGALARLTGVRHEPKEDKALDGAGEVRLQASWDDGRLVVWAAGPGTSAASIEELSERLKAIDAPAGGWWPHDPVPLPSDVRAPAQAIGMAQALGWLVAVGAGDRPDGVGTGIVWLGRVAAWAVGLVARGSIVPRLESAATPSAFAVRWAPALVERAKLDSLSRSMPASVAALDRSEPRTLTLAVLGWAPGTPGRSPGGPDRRRRVRVGDHQSRWQALRGPAPPGCGPRRAPGALG